MRLDSENMNEIVSAKGLGFMYDGKNVWANANFSIKRGEFVAVIGPNGAGKTTLFRMLLGLLKPSSGTIKILGSRPRRGNPKIGYVPQRHTIDNETNIECIELIRLAYSCNKLSIFPSADEKGAAISALREVGAKELANKSLAKLSGGELQRIFLAEALVSKPEVLLLDEPLSNLDIKRAKELVEVIGDVVKSRNVTAFLVAHDINPLMQFLDKVIYIANGRVATGTPKEVLTSKNLSALYGTHVEVLRDSRGHILIHSLYGGEDLHEDEYHVI